MNAPAGGLRDPVEETRQSEKVHLQDGSRMDQLAGITPEADVWCNWCGRSRRTFERKNAALLKGEWKGGQV